MSKKPPNDGSLQSTKQMLDELDSLMEKMLSLPMNDLESSALPESPSGPSVLTSPMTLAAPLIETKLPAPKFQAFDESTKDVAPPEAPPHPSLNPPHMSRPAVEPRRKQATAPFAKSPPRPEVAPLTNDFTLPESLAAMDPLLADMPAPVTAGSASAPTMDFTPFVWVNRQFDNVTSVFPGGRWLRSHGGRNVLGVSGALMTLTAVAWLLKDWLGWN